MELQKDYRLEKVISSWLLKLNFSRCAFKDSMTFAYRRWGVLGVGLAVKKCKVVSLKAPADGPKRCLRRTLSAVSPRCSSRRSLREGWNRFLGWASSSPSHSQSLGLSPLRGKQSIRAELEVTTGHRLNQSKPHFISLPPTRALPSSLLSLFLFLSSRDLLLVSLALSPSPFSFHLNSLLPVSSRPGSSTGRDVKGLTDPELNEDRCCMSGGTGST